MSYHVLHDLDLCDGHARCVLAAPSVFEIGDGDDVARVLDEYPPEAGRMAVQAAADACPKGAISIKAGLT
jgi:ferredoxin